MEFTVKKTELFFMYFDEKSAEFYNDKRGRGLRILLGVYMNGKKIPLGDEDAYDWEPDIYHNSGIKVEIKNWKELEGQIFEWESNWHKDYAEAGFLYVTEHEEIARARIEIIERNENQFKIKWSGEANIFWNDEWDKNVPFDCEFAAVLAEHFVRFTGLYFFLAALYYYLLWRRIIRLLSHF